MGYRKRAFIAWSPRNLSAQIQSSSRLRGAAFGKSSIVSHLVNRRAQSMLPQPLPSYASALFWVSRLAAKYLIFLVGAPGLEPGTR